MSHPFFPRADVHKPQDLTISDPSQLLWFAALTCELTLTAIIDMTYIMLTSFVDILSDNREPTLLH